MYRLVSGLVTTAALLCAHSVGAAPKADLWERWSAHDASAVQRVDHDLWSGFLKQYLTPDRDGLNRVDYAKVRSTDRRKLQQYLDYLQTIQVSQFNRDEQFAYWVNLYNALTVHVVLERFPVQSIRDISGGLFSFGPWRKERVSVEGEALSLDDIEHRILSLLDD